jgi:hypothetical protein
MQRRTVDLSVIDIPRMRRRKRPFLQDEAGLGSRW